MPADLEVHPHLLQGWQYWVVSVYGLDAVSFLGQAFPPGLHLEADLSLGSAQGPGARVRAGAGPGHAEPSSSPQSVPSKTCALLSDKCVLIPAQQEASKEMILIYFAVFCSLLLSGFGAGDIPAG